MHRKLGKTTPTAANNMLVTLSSLYRYAGELGLVAIDFNPIRNAVARHKTEKKERFLTVDELKRLADTLRAVEQNGLDWKLRPELDLSRAKHRAKPETQKIQVSPFVTAVIRLLLFTGCRLGEIINLRWSEVDFERGTLNLAYSKTGKKTVILNSSAIAILSDLPRDGAYVISRPESECAAREHHTAMVSYSGTSGSRRERWKATVPAARFSAQLRIDRCWWGHGAANCWQTLGSFAGCDHKPVRASGRRPAAPSSQHHWRHDCRCNGLGS